MDLSKQNYVYPQFSEKEICGIRLGGSGLGNLLFIYARAFKFAKEHRCQMIFPTWKSLKIGTWLRWEKDKRFYGNLFENNSGYVDGANKRKILKTAKRVTEETFRPEETGQVVIFNRYVMDFEPFKDYREELKEDLIRNLQQRNRKALTYDFGDSICAHIRLGDFAKANLKQLQSGANNMSIPVSWYREAILAVRAKRGNETKAYIFSDGTDEQLKEVLSLPNVKRISFGTSIADILALSRAKLLLASGSTFSSWARFLGGASTITYTNQLKCKGLAKDGNFEIEANSLTDIELKNG